MTIVKLKKSEISHLLALIEIDEQEGCYYGNKQQWVKRSNKIKQSLKNSIDPFDFKVGKPE